MPVKWDSLTEEQKEDRLEWRGLMVPLAGLHYQFGMTTEYWEGLSDYMKDHYIKWNDQLIHSTSKQMDGTINACNTLKLDPTFLKDLLEASRGNESD